MSKYTLNPKIEQSTEEELFNLLLKYLQIGKSYNTLSGKTKHKIIQVDGNITIDRTEASDQPVITFDEITDVIKLFKGGGSYNTSSKEYVEKLLLPTHKTPLLSILLASEIIVKE